MFCNGCGAALQPDFNVCPTCGRAVAGLHVPVQPTRLERHLRILGILWVVVGALFLIPAIALMSIGSVAQLVIPGTQEITRLIGPLAMFVLGSTFMVLAAGGILVGWGLRKHESWARTVAVVLGILSLFHPPIGTALGIYTLWVLLSDQGGAEYARLAHPA
jgi:hypothetical protein